MPQITSSLDARASRHSKSLANGTQYYKSDFHRAAADGPAVQAQGFLIEQEANSTILPHFHEQNQFQVIVAGGGRLGKHEVGPVSVHFAGAHTPYGPIVSGPEGISYFTLRDGFDPGAKFMPEARRELQRGRYRFVLIGDVAVNEPEKLLRRSGTTVDDVMPAEPDGLAAQVVRAGPDTAIETLDPSTGGGQYHIVLAGSLRQESGEALPVNSCIFVDARERRPELRAGSGGVELLVLQFPRRDAEAAGQPH